ncbi:uncharacterized protein [Clytia hemisphaerica]|uniref:uncharacterized protein n=1 Tax=Clytia hemisphaerica TaxID=252671 RepID=UPI0034D40291
MDTLERLFGLLKFHRYQEEALKAIHSKRDVLICQPTGSGKSLVFQSHPFYFHCSKIDATLPQHSSLAELAKEMKFFVIVISPLNSLMEDQVNSLNAKGVEAIALDQCSKDSTILEFNKKGKGHEEQFQHTTQVLENVDEKALEEKDFDVAKNFLTEGKKLLEERLQHLQIADREGWLVPKHYKRNILVSSGDIQEKHLKDTRKTAEQIKAKMEQENKPKDSKYRRMDEITCYNLLHLLTFCPFVQKQNPNIPSTKSSSSSSSSKRSSTSTSKSRTGK